METRYHQTDLDLVSSRSLATLRTVLSGRGLIEVNEFRRGRLWCAGFESPRTHGTAEQCVRAFLKVLDALDTHERSLLRACSSRNIDIAYGVVEPGRGRFLDGLTAQTIKRLAKHDVGVRITLYPGALSSALQAGLFCAKWLPVTTFGTRPG